MPPLPRASGSPQRRNPHSHLPPIHSHQTRHRSPAHRCTITYSVRRLTPYVVQGNEGAWMRAGFTRWYCDGCGEVVETDTSIREFQQSPPGGHYQLRGRYRLDFCCTACDKGWSIGHIAAVAGDNAWIDPLLETLKTEEGPQKISQTSQKITLPESDPPSRWDPFLR